MRGERKEEKRKMYGVALLVFIMSTLERFLAEKKNCCTDKVHLAVTFSKSWLEDFEKSMNEQ